MRAGLDLGALIPLRHFLAELHFRTRFGEAEYWFSLIRSRPVVIFIIVGVAMIIGIFKGVEAFKAVEQLDDGRAPFAGGFAAMIGVAMIVGFYSPTELVRYCRRGI